MAQGSELTAGTARRRWPIVIDDVLLRFLGCACWNAASVALSRVLNVLALLIASRILGPVLYGQLGVVQNTVAMFGVFAGFGLGITATHFVSLHRRNDPLAAAGVIASLQGLSVLGGAAAALVAICCGPWIATHVLSCAELGPVLQIGSLLVILNTFQGVQQGAFAGLEAVRAAAIVQGLGGTFLVVAMTGGAVWGGVWGCVVAQVATMSVQVVVGQLVLRRAAAESSIVVGVPTWKPTAPGLLAYALPAALCSLMVMPVEWVASVLLVNRPGGFAEMGIYAASWQWVSPVLLVPAVVGQTILPLLGERHAAGDPAAPMRLLAAAVAMNAAVIAPLAVVGMVYSSTLLGISGAEFVRGETTLRLLIVAAALYAVEAPLGQFLAGQGRIWAAFVANLGWAICLLIAVGALVTFGANGVAAARLLSYLCYGVWAAAIVWRLQQRMVHHVCA